VETDLGPLEVVVNAAGVAQRALTPLEAFDLDEWDANLATNLRGTFLVCRTRSPV
jgi:NAD(P)-dependent dehydrogenase (short-subunit alcohol dehydrogenase family)